MNKIKMLRLRLGLSVRELSEKADVAVGYISELENDCNGKKNPTKIVMEKIATALDSTVTEVFY